MPLKELPVMILPSRSSFLVSVNLLGVKYQNVIYFLMLSGDITPLKLKPEKPAKGGCEFRMKTQEGIFILREEDTNT